MSTRQRAAFSMKTGMREAVTGGLHNAPSSHAAVPNFVTTLKLAGVIRSGEAVR